jgi:nucleoprotein TPR
LSSAIIFENSCCHQLQSLSQTRESLVGAETSKKHLEEKVEDLTRQLQGNEEKLAVYERRSSRINGVAQHADPDMTREQQLESEVADLR